MSQITTEQFQQFKTDLVNAMRDTLQQYLGKPKLDMVRSKTAMEILNCSQSKLESLQRKGFLQPIKILGSLYFKRSDLESLFTQQIKDNNAIQNND